MNCRTLMYSESYHIKLFPHHKVIDYESFKVHKSFHKKLREDFLFDYHRRVTKLEGNIGDFSQSLTKQLVNSLDDQVKFLKSENADNLEALKVIDLITAEEYKKLEVFKETFINREEATNKLINDFNNNADGITHSLEQIFKNVVEVEQIFSSEQY